MKKIIFSTILGISLLSASLTKEDVYKKQGTILIDLKEKTVSMKEVELELSEEKEIDEYERKIYEFISISNQPKTKQEELDLLIKVSNILRNTVFEVELEKESFYFIKDNFYIKENKTLISETNIGEKYNKKSRYTKYINSIVPSLISCFSLKSFNYLNEEIGLGFKEIIKDINNHIIYEKEYSKEYCEKITKKD